MNYGFALTHYEEGNFIQHKIGNQDPFGYKVHVKRGVFQLKF